LRSRTPSSAAPLAPPRCATRSWPPATSRASCRSGTWSTPASPSTRCRRTRPSSTPWTAAAARWATAAAASVGSSGGWYVVVRAAGAPPAAYRAARGPAVVKRPPGSGAQPPSARAAAPLLRLQPCCYPGAPPGRRAGAPLGCRPRATAPRSSSRAAGTAACACGTCGSRTHPRQPSSPPTRAPSGG
jgi:hypothetical protein